MPNVAFGQPGIDVPVLGDFDGDKKTDVAVYRTTTGQWFIDYSTANPDGSPRLQGVAFGQVSTADVPVPGDYDGDGRDDLALFRPTNANWLILGSASPGRILASGSANDVPLIAPLQPYRYQRTSVATRSIGGQGGQAALVAEAPAAPTTPDLGRTASSFAAGLAARAAAFKPAPPAIRTRPAQVAIAPQQTATGHRFGHPIQANTIKLGRIKLARRRQAD